MTAEKAASLTSSLLARKGAAKPAALDHDVYRSVTLPTGQAGPTAVVTTLHPPRDDAAPAAADAEEEHAAGHTEMDEAAPEAALTDLRVAVEARSDDQPATDEPGDADATPAAEAPSEDDAIVEANSETAEPSEAVEPAADEAPTEPSTTDEPVTVEPDADKADADTDEVAAAEADATPAADPAALDEAPTESAPEPDAETPVAAVETVEAVETPAQPEPAPVAPMAALPSDRLAAAVAEPAVAERRRGRTLLLSAVIFAASAVAGWYAVQQSPGLQAEFRRLAGQVLTLVYGPAAEAPAGQDASEGAATDTAPAASTPAPNVTAPAERETPEAPASSGTTTPPSPELDASDNTDTPTPATTPTDKRDTLSEVAAADAARPPTEVPEAGEAETAPSIDLVRISPEGDGIIVGRAAPGAELILLDNGEPIGTVTATPAGEWVFQTDEPLPGGEHNFAIVVKKAYGNVTLPSPASRSDGDAPSVAEPAAEEQGSRAGEEEDETSALVPDQPDDAPPVPLSKPGIEMPDATAADGRFVIQLASVKSTAHAERLWAELREDFPELTDGLNLIIDSRRGSNAYVRVRTGPFVARTNAENYCARFKAGNQDCLVVVALPRS